MDDSPLTQFVSPIEFGEMDTTFRALAESGKALTRLPQKKFDRQKVLSALEEAFELIGGVPRLAYWGHENPGEFYKLWGKTIPAAAQVQISGQLDHRFIRPALPPSALDAEVTDGDFIELTDGEGAKSLPDASGVG